MAEINEEIKPKRWRKNLKKVTTARDMMLE